MDLIFNHMYELEDMHISYGHFLVILAAILSVEDIEFQVTESAHPSEFRKIF